MSVTQEFGIYKFHQRVLERVFVGSIVNIKKMSVFFSGFMENELECGTKKSPKSRFAVYTVCLSRPLIQMSTVVDYFLVVLALLALQAV